MSSIELGNVAPTQTTYPDADAAREGRYERRLVEIENAVTTFRIPDRDAAELGDRDPLDVAIAEIGDAWRDHHSLAPPAFVRSVDEELANRIARRYSVSGRARQALADRRKAGQDVLVPPEHEVKVLANRPKGWVPQPTSVAALKATLKQDWPEHLARALAQDNFQALKVNSGNDFQALVMGGEEVGETGTATAVAAASLTNTGAAFPTTGDGYAGHHVVMGAAYAVILSNTGTVLTLDKWYAPATPGGAAAATPALGAYVILPGGQPAFWMAITENAVAPAAADTVLTGELTLSTLARAVATYGHTTGAASYTLSKQFQNPDATARVINKMGNFNSGPAVGGRLVFETLVPSPPTLASASDTVTLTDTIGL